MMEIIILNYNIFVYTTSPLNINSKLLYKYTPKFRQLKTVFIELAYHALEDQRPDDYWRNSSYLRYYGIANSEKVSLINRSIFFAKPELAFRYMLKKKAPQLNEQGFNENNFDGRFKDYKYDEQKIWDRRKKTRHKDESLLIYRKNTQTLKDMISYCHEQGIRVILISPPVYKSYSAEMLDSKKKRRQEFLDSLPSDILFLNYENSAEFSVHDFVNGNHLNTTGAQKFTGILNRTIDSQFNSERP